MVRAYNDSRNETASPTPARLVRIVIFWLLLAADLPVCLSAEEPTSPPPITSKVPRKLYRGQVVAMHAALERQGVKAYPEELRDQYALETPSGKLLPILPDWRGRAFYQDERLRDREVWLVGFRKPGHPYLQVLTIYTLDEEGRPQFTDYWCDVCSIPMYEIKPCDCCQQEIRLRFQPQAPPKEVSAAEPAGEVPSESTGAADEARPAPAATRSAAP
jgi:hypothetical protein